MCVHLALQEEHAPAGMMRLELIPHMLSSHDVIAFFFSSLASRPGSRVIANTFVEADRWMPPSSLFCQLLSKQHRRTLPGTALVVFL